MVGAMTHSEAYLKERSYRVAEALRHQNQREQRRLENIIGQRNGLEAKHRLEMTAVSKEQERIKQELARIKQTISTTWGVLPARDNTDTSATHNGKRRGSRRRSRQDIRVRNEEDQKSTEDRLRRFNESYPIDSPTRSHADTDAANSQSPSHDASAANKNSVDEARDAITRRLTLPHISSDEVGATPRMPVMLPPLEESRSEPAAAGVTVASTVKQKRGLGKTPHTDGVTGASQGVDGARQNAADRVRTVHSLPDLEASLREAKKTRYVRHKKKQWFETELSINEIFHDGKPET